MTIDFKGAHFPPEVILMGVRWYKARHNYRYISAEIKRPSSLLGLERLYAVFTSAKSHNCCAGKGCGP